MTPERKLLGIRAYGHIPHLPGSRLGPGDHHVHEGQVRICTEKARDRHDIIVLQEKLDGSCVAVARIGDEIVPLGRAGYSAYSSPHESIRLFALWVGLNRERFFAVLRDGERICGEWLIQAVGTRYDLPHEPFVAFDIMIGHKREPAKVMLDRLGGLFTTPHIAHIGAPIDTEEAMELVSGSQHGALDPVEGAVWRVERKGEVDFLAKYVRSDKVDGCYLPEMAGKVTWNRWPGSTAWLSLFQMGDRYARNCN